MSMEIFKIFMNEGEKIMIKALNELYIYYVVGKILGVIVGRDEQK